MPVRLFGGPAVVEGEEEVKLSPYQASLVALVWVTGSIGIPRSRVAWLLWESDDDTRARHRISQLLYGITAKTTVASIVAEDDNLKPRDHLESDLGQLRAAGAARPITGQPLGKLTFPPPTRAFEEWLTTQRTTLRYLAIERNGELLTRAEDTHAYDLAADAARAVLEYDPVNERALRSLIRAMALGGSALQAQAAYDRQAVIVRKILGDWKPSRETRRLLGEIDSLRIRQEDPPTDRELQHPVRLVGRSEELNQLRHCCLGDSAPWRDVAVLGEPGVGKSRLLEELARQLELEDCRLVRVRSFAAEEGIAFNLLSDIAKAEPFQEAVRTLAPLWRKILASALSVEPIDVPDEDLPDVPADSASRRVYEALRHLFDGVEGRVVILADGFESADSSSLAALSFLRRRVRHGCIRFVGTVGQEALQGNHSQSQYLRDLLESVDDKLEVQPLLDREATELVKAAANRSWSEGEVSRAVALGGGNPLFLIELGKAGLDETVGSAELSIRQALTNHLDDLSPHTRTFLNALAIQLGPAELNHLSRICEFTRSEALWSLGEAQRRRLIASTPEGVSFRHGIIRRWISDSLSEAEVRFLHGATAEVLVADAGGSADVAHHLSAAGRRQDAYQWACRGAHEAEDRAAHADSVRLWKIAADNAPDSAAKFSATAKLGHLLYRKGDLEEAIHTFKEATAVGTSHGTWEDSIVLRLHLTSASGQLGLVPPREAIDALGSLAKDASYEKHSGLHLAICDAQMVIANGAMLYDAAHSTLQYVSGLRPPDPPSERCQFHSLNAFHVLYGRRTFGIESCDEALRVALAAKLDEAVPKCIQRFLVVHTWAGDLGEKDPIALINQAEERALIAGEFIHLYHTYVNFSTWLLDVGDVDRAHSVMQKAEVLLPEGDDHTLRVPLDNNLGEYHFAKGDFEAAAHHFAKVKKNSTDARRELLESAAAGYRLCCLKLGKLNEALDGGNTVSPEDCLKRPLNFDPSLLIRLRVRLLEIQGMPKDAASFLRESRAFLRERYVLAWLKLGLIEGRLLKKHDLGGHVQVVGEGLSETKRRGYTHLEDAYRRLQ